MVQEKQLHGSALRNLLGISRLLLILGGPIGLVAGGAYLWDEGYVGSYWQRHDSLYDPKLQVYRCLDENGQLTEDIKPPCFVMTLRGVKALERHQKACEKEGGTKEVCLEGAFQWLEAKRPSK